MLPIWISHDGKHHPVSSMNGFHLEGALRKLRAQREMWTRICSGDDPSGMRQYLSNPKCNPWVPLWSPEEMLERTALWIQVIEQELHNRAAAIHGGFRP